MASKETNWDVMISYEWKSGGEYATKLKEYLLDKKYNVWLDKEQMLGTMLEQMAKGVSNSFIIILLISKGYADSHNCFREYAHAHTCKKYIIPVKVEDYHPPNDSALGILISNKRYYKLHEDFDTNASKILKEVQVAKQEDTKSKGSTTSRLLKDKEDKKDSGKKETQSLPNSSKSGAVYNINIYGSTVHIGDNQYLGADSDNQFSQDQDNVSEAKCGSASGRKGKTEAREERAPIQETYLAGVMKDLSIAEKLPPLTPEEAFDMGQDRTLGDFKEEFLDELAGKLSAASSVVGNWEGVAKHLKLDYVIIAKMKDKGMAHRLLFIRIRDTNPGIKVKQIKIILEDKMKRKPRRDIFYDYLKVPGLPSIDREIGSLSIEEFEAILENVADKLVFDNMKGNWRDLGGHLEYPPNILDEIESEGKPMISKPSSRIFVDYLGKVGVKVKELTGALDSVKRIDVKDFIKQQMKEDKCWTQSCARRKANLTAGSELATEQ